jgi:phosphomannomutase
MVGIALFLTKLAQYGKSVSRLRASYPNYFISKQKIELTPDIDVDNLLSSIKDRYQKHPINDVDGVKIEFENEWVHLRRSNTEPIIRIYTESETMATAEHLGSKIISDMKEIITSNH